MRMYPKEFPPKRRRKPTRRAELRIFNALASSPLHGFAYYEWRKDFDEPELDFAVWIQDHGRAALQVKGGRYQLVNGDWVLHTRNAVKAVRSSPIDEAWMSALDLHDDIKEKGHTSYDPFVSAVLALPDMDFDKAIYNLARRKKVSLIWKEDQPDKRLQEVLRTQPVRRPLPPERIAREVHAATDGLIQLDPAILGDVATSCPKLPDNFSIAGPAPPAKRLMINLGHACLIEARAHVIQVHTQIRR